MIDQYRSVAVIGEGLLVPEISLCLLKAGHQVVIFRQHTEDSESDMLTVTDPNASEATDTENQLTLVSSLEELPEVNLVVLVTPEDLNIKHAYLRKIERKIVEATPIAVNTESFSLMELRKGSRSPGQIVGLNWVRPAHSTLFAELIVLPDTSQTLVDSLMDLMKNWKKDPYVVYQGKSIRFRMMAAMIREAFFLIENGYVTEEDIDRACRNDAGYYLPFAGNLRYMDLMGTYVYGIVMEDLNKELATSHDLPAFFCEILDKFSNPGLDSGRGFYSYTTGERGKFENEFLAFGEKIRELMDRYPFPKHSDEAGISPLKNNTAFTHKNRSH